MRVVLITVMMIIMMMMMMVMKTTAEGIQMKDISVGPNGVWGVDSADYARILTSHGTSRSWDRCTDSRKMTHVDVGKDFSWGTAQAYASVYHTDSQRCSKSWAINELTHGYVTVSPSGHVWALQNYDKSISTCNDCADNGTPGRSWTQVEGDADGKQFKQISAGLSGLWAVDNNNDVYYMENTYGDERPVSIDVTLTKVEDLKMTHVSSARHHVYGISEGKLYARLGMSSANPTGTVWQHIFKDFSHLTVVDALEDEAIWVIDTKQGSYAYVGSLAYDVNRVA